MRIDKRAGWLKHFSMASQRIKMSLFYIKLKVNKLHIFKPGGLGL